MRIILLLLMLLGISLQSKTYAAPPTNKVKITKYVGVGNVSNSKFTINQPTYTYITQVMKVDKALIQLALQKGLGWVLTKQVERDKELSIKFTVISKKLVDLQAGQKGVEAHLSHGQETQTRAIEELKQQVALIQIQQQSSRNSASQNINAAIAFITDCEKYQKEPEYARLQKLVQTNQLVEADQLADQLNARQGEQESDIQALKAAKARGERKAILAYPAYASGDYRTAIARYEVALQLYPEQLEAMKNLADSYQALPKPELQKARLLWEKVISLTAEKYPNRPDKILLLAQDLPTTQLQALIKINEKPYDLLAIELSRRSLFGISALSSEVLRQSLVTFLKDPDSDVRLSAAKVLGNQNLNGQTVNTLLPLLKDPDKNVRLTTVWALRNQNLDTQTIHTLLPLLKDPSSNVRLITVWALRNQNLDAQAIQILLSLLKDADSNVRSTAAEALSFQNLNIQTINTLLTILKNSDISVRLFAAEALENQNLDAQTIHTLLPFLKDPDSNVRLSAAMVLGNQNLDVQVINALLPLLKDPDNEVRLTTIQALGNQNLDAQAVNTLLPLLKDPDNDIRLTSAKALTFQNLDIQATQILFNLLEDTDINISRTAANALLSHLDAHSLSILLKDPDNDIRLNVLEALKEQNLDTQTIHTLLTLLKDPDNDVRLNVLEALKEQNLDTQTIHTLLTLLKDPDNNVRLYATEALRSQRLDTQTIHALFTILETIPKDDLLIEFGDFLAYIYINETQTEEKKRIREQLLEWANGNNSKLIPIAVAALEVIQQTEPNRK